MQIFPKMTSLKWGDDENLSADILERIWESDEGGSLFNIHPFISRITQCQWHQWYPMPMVVTKKYFHGQCPLVLPPSHHRISRLLRLPWLALLSWWVAWSQLKWCVSNDFLKMKTFTFFSFSFHQHNYNLKHLPTIYLSAHITVS